jgi:hypothetical protein
VKTVMLEPEAIRRKKRRKQISLLPLWVDAEGGLFVSEGCDKSVAVDTRKGLGLCDVDALASGTTEA